MSRHALTAFLLAPLFAVPAAAQSQVGPPERIDLTIPQPPDDAALADCRRRQDAAEVSGEIVVCGAVEDDSDRSGFDREAWEADYARRTRGGDPVDVAGAGIFRGKPTIGGLCIPGLQKCPPPPAIIVDFASLPEAPPGSDADRIARGLPPRGSQSEAMPAPGLGTVAAERERALGLPAPPDSAASDEATAVPVSPAGSEAPGAPR